jgi:uncharacterized protein (UPF0303 family)
MNLEKLTKLVKQQEEMLQFPHFDRLDAWELGNTLVKTVLEQHITLTASIRLFTGLIVFQYAPEGTNWDNERWMTKKYNTVREFEKSTLLHTLWLKQRKETFESRGLDPANYAWGGGGFPIRVKGTGVIGAFIASGLKGLEDHDYLVSAAASFLNVSNVPHIPVREKI